jgi:hypothetical protein
MVSRKILETYTVPELKAEMRKVKTAFNYGKLRKDELIDLMMANKEKFKHIKSKPIVMKMKVLFEGPKPKPKAKK